MIRIYDTNHDYQGFIEDYKDLCIEEVLTTGLKSISFKAPCQEEYYIMLQEEYYLETADYNYIIKEVNFDGNDFFEVFAVADTEELYSTFFRAFDVLERSLQQAYEYAIANSAWTVQYNSSNSSIATYQLPNVTALDMIYQIAEDYVQELWFDTKAKVLHVYDKMGSSLGAWYSNELKLENLKKQSSTYDYATVLFPIGKNGLKITDINNGREFLENFSYSNKYIEKVWINEDYDVAERLKAAAEIYLDSIAQPQSSYKLSLSTIGESVQLGDEIMLIDKLKRIKQKQRVVRIVRYPDQPEEDSLELSNIQADFARDFVKKQKLYDKEIAYIKSVIETLG